MVWEAVANGAHDTKLQTCTVEQYGKDYRWYQAGKKDMRIEWVCTRTRKKK